MIPVISKTKSDSEKKVIAFIFALVITGLIVGSYVLYRRAFPEENKTSFSVFDMDEMKSIKENFNMFGEEFRPLEELEEVMADESLYLDDAVFEQSTSTGSTTSEQI